jgi:hypothetical protein
MRLPPEPFGIMVMLRNARDREANPMIPRHINPVQWQQSVGYARQVCARFFRDGGKPADALAQFGMANSEPTVDWSVAVERIAQVLCAPALRKAA